MSSVWSERTQTIFLFGGTSSIHAGNRDWILEFDPVAETIAEKSAVLPSPRYAPACTVNSETGKIYCFGGREADGALAEIVEYDPETDAVQVKSTSMPDTILYPSCVEDSVDHLIYCIGGLGSSTTYRDSILVYDPDADTISEKAATMIRGRFGHSCVEQPSTNRLFCFGGSRNVVNLREIVEYVPYLPMTGDITDDGQLDLADAITSLKTAAGQSTNGINRKADGDGDRKIGVQDAIFQLTENSY